MASPASTKKQIVDSIKQANSILVTVSRNPSVDELSAALGLTIFLNKLEKHATAVFSGRVPMAISFLEPDKTFEATADSLRDFIIALDKEKADHLRYKVVDESVKIFITPYRTTITESDLEFSQGDYNVELVIALNVEKHDYLDAALTAHGKILHDADIVTITAGETKSTLGSTDWHDDNASGVSEMLVSLLGDLKSQKVSIDKQIATALLTGIVSATDRFANEATSSRAMTASATLMAAGANQQLIATKLEAAERNEDSGDDTVSRVAQGIDGSTFLKEGAATKLVSQKYKDEPDTESHQDDDDGSITITHSKANDLDEVARQVAEQHQRKAAKVAKAKLDKLTSSNKSKQDSSQSDIDDKEPVDIFAAVEGDSLGAEQLAPSPPDIAEDLRRTTEQMAADAQRQDLPAISPSVISPSVANNVPTVGGTLNATTAQAAEDKRRVLELDQNRTILKHGKPIGSRVPSLSNGAFNASMAPPDTPQSVDVFTGPAPSFSDPLGTGAAPMPAQQPAPVMPASPEPQQYIEQLPPQYQQPQQAPANYAPASNQAPTIAELEAERSARAVAQAAPQPPLPPMPDFNNLPPLPPMPTGVDPAGLPSLPSVPPNQQAPIPQDFNPSQFQIPAQQ